MLPNQRDSAVFKAALELYEAKKYKNALAELEKLLKKYPVHAESLCLKGLVLHHLKDKDAESFISKGIESNPASFMAWQVAGIFYKINKNYPQAYKCYLSSLRYEANNPNVLQDLGMLSVHLRNFNVFLNVSKAIVEAKPNVRLSLMSLALAEYLTGNYGEAETVLNRVEKLDKESAENLEKNGSLQAKSMLKVQISERELFRNRIIYKSGNLERALKHLVSQKDVIQDKIAVLEARAKYLTAKDQKQDAIEAYKTLIERNPSSAGYHSSLMSVMGIDTNQKKIDYFCEMAEKYPASQTPKLALLDLYQDSQLESYVTELVHDKISNGVPATFSLVKSLYADNKELMTRAVDALPAFDSESEPIREAFRLLFLTKHYSYLDQHEKALEVVNKAIEHTPTLAELYLAKAKVLFRQGDLAGAAEAAKEAANLDRGDRYLNSKAARYALRAGQLEAGVQLASQFPVSSGYTSDGIKYLADLEAVDSLILLARAYKEACDHSLALKRSLNVVEIFDTYNKNQYDFHYYAPRRGTIMAYLKLLEWEDSLFDHPKYFEGVAIAIQEYVALATNEPDGSNPEARKKLRKSRMKLSQKLVERPPIKPKNDVGEEEIDQDPLGLSHLEVRDYLAEATKLLNTLLESCPTKYATWQLAFDVYLAQNKYVMAMQALKKAKEFGAPEVWVSAGGVRLRHQLATDESAPSAIKSLQLKMLPGVVTQGNIAEADLKEYCDEFLSCDPLIFARIRYQIGYLDGVEEELAKNLEDISLCVKVHRQLVCYGLGSKYGLKVKERWPLASFV